MGSKQARELKEFIADALTEAGVVEFRFSIARNSHQQVEFYHRGIRCKYQFPYSPSDYRGQENARASIKKVLRTAEGRALSGGAQDRTVLDAGGVLPRKPDYVGAGGAGVRHLKASVRGRWQACPGKTLAPT